MFNSIAVCEICLRKHLAKIKFQKMTSDSIANGECDLQKRLVKLIYFLVNVKKHIVILLLLWARVTSWQYLQCFLSLESPDHPHPHPTALSPPRRGRRTSRQGDEPAGCLLGAPQHPVSPKKFHKVPKKVPKRSPTPCYKERVSKGGCNSQARHPK